MIRVIVPESSNKLSEQKRALEYAISQDTNEKDKAIHKKALEQITKALESY